MTRLLRLVSPTLPVGIVSTPTPGAGPQPSAPQTPGWEQTYAELAAAERQGRLSPADLERLAVVAYLTGRDVHSTDVLSRAFQAFVASGHAQRAARAAFWLAFQLLHAGERAPASGWMMRGRRLLDEGGHDCVEQGYLMMPAGILRVSEGDLKGALAAFTEAAEIGGRFGDVDLTISPARAADARSSGWARRRAASRSSTK